jgi:hypothetical protein
MFDKVNELKDQAAGMADKAKDLASKVPGGEGIAEKIDEVTSKIPGMGDAEAAVEDAAEVVDEATE